MPRLRKFAVALVALFCGVVIAPAFTRTKEDADPEPPSSYKHPKTLEDLAKLTDNPMHLARGAAELRKKYANLCDVEKAYKPRQRGGIGIGPPARTDGMEYKLFQLQRGATVRAAEAALKKEKDDLVKLARTTLAINEITRLFFDKPVQGKGAKDWAKYTDEVKKGAEDLLKAVKKQDAAAVKKAVVLIINGCTNCHADFRQ